MAIEIFKNDEDDILFGQDGNVFKTPYDFGGAIKGLGTTFVSIPMDGTLMYDNLTVGSFLLNKTLVGANADNYWLSILAGSQYSRLRGIALASGLGTSFQVVTESGNATTTVIQNVTRLFSIRSNGVNLIKSEGNVNQAISYIAANTPISAIESRVLALSGYLIPQMAMGELFIFSRVLSDSEILYKNDNNNGSDFMSTIGLYCFYRFELAEVINISGVDQPCVRDYSGNNRHGIIMNLPAGTAQQKVDYANANLFVNFII